MSYTQPATAVTGATATAAFWNTYVRDNLNAGFPVDPDAAEVWSPTLQATTSDPDTTVTGRKWRVGPIQKVWARFVMSSLNEGSGTYFVTLPVAASGVTADSSFGQVVGSFAAVDASAANHQPGAVFLASLTQVRFRLTGAVVTNTTPFVWDQTDVLSFSAEYPVA